MDNIQIPITENGTTTLATAGKYCDRNIEVEVNTPDRYEEGRQAEYDAFWDIYQENGTRATYINAFYYKYWDDKTYNPKYAMIVTGSATSAFAYSRITDTKVDVDISNSGNITGLFQSCERLITIRKLIVSEATPFVSTSFSGCKKLIDITIEGTIGVSISFPNSPDLSAASADSIINALKDLTGQTAQKLTIHADVGARLIQAQKDAISAKNWTLVY